jgi:hypothetical protein
MRITQEISPGVKTVYLTPISPLNKFAKVATVLTPLASQSESSVTFSVAPAAGASVEIYFGSDIALPPAVRTASGFGGVMPAPTMEKGLTLFLNVTAASGTTPTLDCKVQQWDAVSGLFFDLPSASFAQITGVGSAALSIFGGAASVANVALNSLVRCPYRIAFTIGGTSPSFTFSVGATSFN